jgi:glycine/D-amino acid oxidase-like deaminating enzyme
VIDVAVVGGGVIGLSAARELLRLGVERVWVLERNSAVGEESSSRANGGVRAQFFTPVNIAFSRYSISEFESLEETEGDLLSFRQAGYLLLAGTQAGEDMLREAFQLQRALGVDTRWLTPQEVSQRVPFVRTEGLRAATFHSRDGFLDPHGVVSAFARQARQLGAEIRTRTEVLGIRRGHDGFEVLTNGDTVHARWVVNAAGAHAARVAGMVSADIPVTPIRRNLAFARSEAGPRDLFPMCVDLDTGVLVRPESNDGYLLAYSDPADPPSWDTSLDPKFLEQLAERVGHRFPFLENATIDPRQCWAGLYPETPDHHAVIGEAEVPRFIIAAGFGGHGVMHSPAAGRAVAEIVAHGSCRTFDLHALRPARFQEGELVVERAVL